MPHLPRENVVDCVKTMAYNGYLERVSLVLWRVVSKVKKKRTAKEQGTC